MAWLERRRKPFRIVFRFREERLSVNLKATDQKEANACLARLEENLRLVERGRLTVPDGATSVSFCCRTGSSTSRFNSSGR